MAALRYFIRDYLLSYRYFAPLTLYALSVALIYGVTPNPVMASYSFTSTALFAISAWLSFGYIDLEPETQQMITSLHMRSLRKYYFLKALPPFALTAILSLLVTVYPAWTDKFDRLPSGTEYAVALISHIGLAWLGVAAGFLFTRKWLPKWYMAWGGLSGFVAVSLATAGIVKSLPPDFRFVGWLLPPLSRTMDMLNAYETASAWEVVVGTALPYVYALLLFAIFVAVMVRRKF